MFFPHFTDQEVTINGSWQGDDRQLRFTGTISPGTPFVILSLVRCGDEYHYMKNRKSNALKIPLNLYQGKFPHQNRYQHTLMIGNSVNMGAVSQGRLFIRDDLPMTFQSGRLFTFATDAQNQPFIYLLAIAKVDIKSKRCGIWTVKPRLLEGVDESWRGVFTRTRHGWMRIADAS